MPRLTSVASKILSAASSGADVNLTVSQYFLTLDNPNVYDTSAGDSFGWAVAISSNRAIVGAPFEGDAGGASSGKAYIFDADSGSLLLTLDNPNAYNTSVGDDFGYGVDIDGDRAIVGAAFEDAAAGAQSGRVYVFDVTNGSLLQTIDNPNASLLDRFGWKLALSGNRAIVGVINEGGISGGTAYIFDITDGSLVQTLANPNAYGSIDNDNFGGSVDISGNRCIVGARGEDDGNLAAQQDSGKAYVYEIPQVDPGDINSTFAANVGTGFNNVVWGTAIQSDGKILVGGQFSSYDGVTQNRITRLNTDGTRDTGFTTGTGFNNIVYAMALQSDGKIVVGGAFTSYDGTTQNRITRLNADGTRDTGFTTGTGFDGIVFNVALQSDGKILVGGFFTSYDGTTQIRITRLNADGTRDTGFTTGTGFDNTVSAIAQQSDGKILVGGNFGEYDGTAQNSITRLNADGTRDTTFSIGTGFDLQVRAFAIQPDGKILVGGQFTSYDGVTQNRITRLNTNGTRDTGFSIGTGFSSEVYALDIQSDGKILVGGGFSSYDGVTQNHITRLNTDGTRDTGFSIGTGFNGIVRAIALQSVTKILVGGQFTSYDGVTQNRIAVIETGLPYFEHKYTLNNPNAYGTAQQDGFGGSVAIDGNYCIVGASSEDDAGGVGSGKAYIFDVTTGALVHTLNNPNAYDTSAGDIFGSAVDISGDRCIVGAWGEDDAGGALSGKAYIFDVTTGALLHTLDNPNAYGTSAQDQFANANGSSVSISGDRAIVGAYEEDDAGGASSGKAYIFSNSISSVDEGSALGLTTSSIGIPDNTTLYWTVSNAGDFSTSSGSFVINDNRGYFSMIPTADVLYEGNETFTISIKANNNPSGNVLATSKQITINDVSRPPFSILTTTIDNPNSFGGPGFDNFGIGLAASGNMIVVGARDEDTATATNPGVVYVFDLNGTQLDRIDNPNIYGTPDSDQFGAWVGVGPTRIVVSAPQEDDAGGQASGAAYIFDTSGNLLNSLANPNPVGTSASDSFGNGKIAVTELYTVLAASQEDESLSVRDSGKVYVYNNSNGTLARTINNPNAYGTADADFFGSSCAATDTRLIVGASAEDDAGGISSGKVYIFDITNGTLLHTLDNPNAYSTSEIDSFGLSVAISPTGTYAIVGAPTEDDATGANSGKAYIFDVATGSLLHTLDNPNSYDTGAADQFGWEVAINDTYAVVGAPQEDREPAPEESFTAGFGVGVIYVFRVSDGALVSTITNPKPIDAQQDQFGYRIALTEHDGYSWIIVGVFNWDIDTTDRSVGRVYVYKE